MDKMHKVLHFCVGGALLFKPNIQDFKNIPQTTQNYLQCKFDLSTEWEEVIKIAVFRCGGTEEAVNLDNNNMCVIPNNICSKSSFSVELFGKSKSQELITNKEYVFLGGM